MILLAETVFLIPALLIAVYEKNAGVMRAFAVTAGVALGLAIVSRLLSIGADRRMYAKEGYVAVAFGWILLGLVGALPFVLSGEIPNYLNALFEIVSGFTTTGASILEDVEVLSMAALYWRSFSHWVGGMGVLVFLLAIVPTGGRNEGFTLHLFRAESPGPDVGKLVPKLRKTAAVLYGTYILLTVIDFLFLWVDLPAFDAVCTAFGTAGTGGFGIKNASIADYSPYIQNVCTVFMLLFGVNFSCYYLLLLRQFRAVLKDEELRLYGGIVLGSVTLITVNLLMEKVGGYSFSEALRHAAFQVASITSTTGYASTNFETWPSFSKAILMFLMMTGACAGSTCGGMKLARMMLLFKSIRRNISKILHPRTVKPIRVNGGSVDEAVIANTNAYLAAYIAILSFSFLIVSIDGKPLLANFTAVLSCFNNIGPAFTDTAIFNYAELGVLSKLTLIVDMLAGRLEIFPILILFAGSKRKILR